MSTRKSFLAVLLAIAGIMYMGCDSDFSDASSGTVDSSTIEIVKADIEIAETSQDMLFETAETTVPGLQDASLTTNEDVQEFVATTPDDGSDEGINTDTQEETTAESTTTTETTVSDIIAETISSETTEYESSDDLQKKSEQDTSEENSLVKDQGNSEAGEEQTETMTTTQTECAESTYETTTQQVMDAIVINDKVIEIEHGPANQENIDKYDVVQDTEYWSTEKSKFLFGHNFRSFSCLSKINVGDTITLINNGCACEYVVTRSEKGELANEGMDIRSCVDDTMLITADFERDNIRLITCFNYFSPTYRWVVIAEKTE
ncbi:MAG: hypothetical protein IKE01_06940 [Clostridia bacterium]|nr:hypothetical protein [Clostridia bacterium]